jgi:hypothetical protein
MPFSDLAFSASNRCLCVWKCGSHVRRVAVFPSFAGRKRILAGKVALAFANVGERVGVFTSFVSFARVLPLKFRRIS